MVEIPKRGKPEKRPDPKEVEPGQCFVTLEKWQEQEFFDKLRATMAANGLQEGRHIIISATPIKSKEEGAAEQTFVKVTFTAQMEGKNSAAMQVYGVLRPFDQPEVPPPKF